MNQKFLRLIDKIFGSTLRNFYEVPSMERSFQNMRKLGFTPQFIIDIGAFNGKWTYMALAVFPEASILMQW